MRRLAIRATLALLPLLACVSRPAHAAVNDVFPSDYVALPAGSQVLTGYLYSREFDGPYAHRQKLTADTVYASIAALRWSKFFRLGDHTFAPLMALPWSSTGPNGKVLTSALGKDAAGWGDIRAGATVWLVNRPKEGEFLGVTGLVSAPTGDYDPQQVLNIGENRWKLTLMLGWIQPLNEKWVVDLVPELAFYGDNDRYAGSNRLEQKPSGALTGYLRYRVSPSLQFHLGGQANAGGETLLNGIAQGNAARNFKGMIGATYLTEGKMQLTARYSQDGAIDNGFRSSNELALRVQKAF